MIRNPNNLIPRRTRAETTAALAIIAATALFTCCLGIGLLTLIERIHP
jgi:hypothetical protein